MYSLSADLISGMVSPRPLGYCSVTITGIFSIEEVFARIRALDVSCEGGFIFVREKGGRCTGHDISCALDRRASEAGVKKTSIHGIRRTVSSILRTKLPVRTVANMLGHVEQTNEEHYNYDFYDNDSKIEALSSVLALSTNVHTKF